MWCVSRLLWSAFAGRFLFFAVGVKVRGGSVLSARSVAVLAVLSASYLVVSGGLSLDVRLDLVPFDNLIIYHCASTFNMQIAQRYTLA